MHGYYLHITEYCDIMCFVDLIKSLQFCSLFKEIILLYVTPFVLPEIRLKSDSSSPKHFDFLATSITLEGGFT